MKKTTEGRLLNLTIDDLNSEGQGVARLGRDVYFVPGALPGEQVTARLMKRARKIWNTRLVTVEQRSADRTEPSCPHYQRCGGCDLQHLTYDAQVAYKQKRAARELARKGVVIDEWQPPLTAEPWHYRRKARLGVRFSKEQGHNFVGFREAGSSHLTDIQQCPVLPDHPALNWEAWRDLINQLQARDQITQIEPLFADNALAFILRVLKPLSAADLEHLTGFLSQQQAQGGDYPLQLWVREEKGAKAQCLWPADAEPLWHEVSGVRLAISPEDFVQINPAVNRAMVDQAIAWLAPQSEELIWDLFAGHGNFSVPLTQASGQVMAVEGQESMVQQLKEQAERLALPLQAMAADLSAEGALQALPDPDVVLLDPPRAGATEVVAQLKQRKPGRILYVSCDVATLARDAGALCESGYAVQKAGIMDMFPQTHHVETMLLLTYGGQTHG